MPSARELSPLPCTNAALALNPRPPLVSCQRFPSGDWASRRMWPRPSSGSARLPPPSSPATPSWSTAETPCREEHLASVCSQALSYVLQLDASYGQLNVCLSTCERAKVIIH